MVHAIQSVLGTKEEEKEKEHHRRRAHLNAGGLEERSISKGNHEAKQEQEKFGGGETLSLIKETTQPGSTFLHEKSRDRVREADESKKKRTRKSEGEHSGYWILTQISRREGVQRPTSNKPGQPAERNSWGEI